MKTEIAIILIILFLLFGVLVGFYVADSLKTCSCELQQLGNISICLGK